MAMYWDAAIRNSGGMRMRLYPFYGREIVSMVMQRTASRSCLGSVRVSANCNNGGITRVMTMRNNAIGTVSHSMIVRLRQSHYPQIPSQAPRPPHDYEAGSRQSSLGSHDCDWESVGWAPRPLSNVCGAAYHLRTPSPSLVRVRFDLINAAPGMAMLSTPR